MSAIVAAARLQAMVGLFTALSGTDEQCEVIRNELRAAGRAIAAASNAAGAGRVVEGAPRTWAVRWSAPLWPSGRDWIARDSQWQILAEAISPHAGLRPCWDAANRLWVWSAAAHDPRPCAWPRPFARGADR